MPAIQLRNDQISKARTLASQRRRSSLTLGPTRAQNASVRLQLIARLTCGRCELAHKEAAKPPFKGRHSECQSRSRRFGCTDFALQLTAWASCNHAPDGLGSAGAFAEAK